MKAHKQDVISRAFDLRRLCTMNGLKTIQVCWSEARSPVFTVNIVPLVCITFSANQGIFKLCYVMHFTGAAIDETFSFVSVNQSLRVRTPSSHDASTSSFY